MHHHSAVGHEATRVHLQRATIVDSTTKLRVHDAAHHKGQVSIAGTTRVKQKCWCQQAGGGGTHIHGHVGPDRAGVHLHHANIVDRTPTPATPNLSAIAQLKIVYYQESVARRHDQLHALIAIQCRPPLLRHKSQGAINGERSSKHKNPWSELDARHVGFSHCCHQGV